MCTTITSAGCWTRAVSPRSRTRGTCCNGDLEWQRTLGAEDDEDRAIWELLAPLETRGMLDAIDGDHTLATGIELHHLPGHTPGHQIVRIESGADLLTISADTWNHPLQLEHPEWPSGPDNDHAGA